MSLEASKAFIEMELPCFYVGLTYIEDAMELYEKHGSAMSNMVLVYFAISKKRRVSSTEIMNRISDVIDYAYTKGDIGNVVKYFGLTRRSNGNHLAVLYQRLKEEKKCKE